MESEVVVYAEILYFRRHVCEEGSSEIDCKVIMKMSLRNNLSTPQKSFWKV